MLTLSKEVCRKQERHKPLQKGSSPPPQRLAKPTEQRVSTFVDDQVCRVDEQKSVMRPECIRQEPEIEDKPQGDRPSWQGLPVLPPTAPFRECIDKVAHLPQF